MAQQWALAKENARPGGTRFRPMGRKRALTLAAAMLLGALSLDTLGQEALTGDQIRTLITGNTLQGSYVAKRLVMVFYADGVVRGAMGLRGSDSGTWEIEGNTYCNEWFTYFQGVRRCYRWIPRGDGYLLDNVDSYKTQPIVGHIVQGKPKGY